MKSALLPKLVAVVGGSGSGKSWLVDRLQSMLGHATARLSQDSFYRDRSHLPLSRRERINYDHPRSIDWPCLEQWLQHCRAGQPALVPHYDFKTHSRLPEGEKWAPKPLVLVDGLWLLRRPSLRRCFDFSIYIDCPARLRLSRRLARDRAERGRSAPSIRRQFLATVAPMHDQFVAPQKRYAKVVLQSPCDPAEVVRLAEMLRHWLPPGLRAANLDAAGLSCPKQDWARLFA